MPEETGAERPGVVLWCEALAAVEDARRCIGELAGVLPVPLLIGFGPKAAAAVRSLEAVADVVGLLVNEAIERAECGEVAGGRAE